MPMTIAVRAQNGVSTLSFMDVSLWRDCRKAVMVDLLLPGAVDCSVEDQCADETQGDYVALRLASARSPQRAACREETSAGI
jgi:hypothetical protein